MQEQFERRVSKMPFCESLAKHIGRIGWVFLAFVFLNSCQTASRFGSFDRDVLDEVQASLSSSEFNLKRKKIR